MKPVFIIAEAGVNHNGDVRIARRMIHAARKAGADAVKFQIFRAETLVTPKAPKARYQLKGTGAKESQFKMLKKLELTHTDFLSLKKECSRKEILFMATPFDEESVDFLEPLVDRYKISSGDLTNTPLLQHMARKGKPVILSTGMATMEEIQEAMDVLEGAPVTLLHCTTNYPCPFDEANLRAIVTLREEFNTPVGYSDHTAGIEAAIAAVALGATVVEKHFTLDRKMKGPDYKASLEPDELEKMVASIRIIERALGDGIKKPLPSELKIAKQARRSLAFARDLTAGSILTDGDLVAKRPGTGLSPGQKDQMVGRRITRDVAKDELLSPEVVG